MDCLDALARAVFTIMSDDRVSDSLYVDAAAVICVPWDKFWKAFLKTTNHRQEHLRIVMLS